MSEDTITREAAALWREVFGEPPAILCDGRLMLELIVAALPAVGYEASAHASPLAQERDHAEPGGGGGATSRKAA